MADATTTTTSAASHHEKTPAEVIKDKAISSLSSDGNTHTEEGVTTNPDEAHAKPSPPSLKSQNTAGTTSTDRGGADDNASMIPLGAGKGDATNTGGMQTPAIEETSFSSTAGAQAPTTTSSSGAGASLTRSNSYILAPTRAEIDVAKAAIIQAVVNCPVDREVSFSQADKGTDTGRIEVRQILKGYKGIDEAIREMNRSNHVRVRDTDAMSATEAREAFGINDDGEGNLSFAATGAGRSGTTTPLLAQGESGAKDSLAPLSTKKSSDILTEKEALATTPIDGPSTAPAAAGTGTGAAASDSTKPDLVRLNTLQREELGKVPDSTASGLPSSTDSTEKRARSGTNPVGAAAAASTATAGGAESSGPASGSQGTTTGATTSAGNGNADDDAAFTEKLRREIEERAKETKEARAERRQSISGGDNTSSVANASSTSGTDDKASTTLSGEKASAVTGDDQSDDKLKPAAAAAALPFAAAPIPSPAVPSEDKTSSDAQTATSSKPSESADVPPTIAEEGTATKSEPTEVKVEEVRPSPAQRGSVLSVAEIMAGRPTNKSVDTSADTRKEGAGAISAMTETTVTPAPEVDAAIVPTTTIPAKATSSSSHLDTPNQLPAFDFEKHSRPGTPGLSSILDSTTGATEADKTAAGYEPTMAPVTGVPSAGGASDAVSGTASHPSAFTEEFDQSTSPTSATRSAGPAAPAPSTPAAKETSVTYGNLTKPNGASNTPSTGRRSSKDNGKSGGFLSGLFRRKSKTVKPSAGSNISNPSPVSTAPASRSAPAAKDAFIVVEEEEKDAPQTVVDGKLEDGTIVGEHAPSASAADAVSVTGKDTTPAANGTSDIGKDATPDQAEELAGDAVAGDIPVIEREVEAAAPKDADPASSIAPASIVDLQDGPKETVAEPTKSARSRASTRSSSSSVTAEDVDAPLTTTAATPTETTAGDGLAPTTSTTENELLSKSESRATASREVAAPVAAPAAPRSNARPAPIARVAPPPKKKNRLSLLFSRKKDTPPSASLQTYEPPSSRPPPISTASPVSPAKKDAATDTETDTALSPTSPASFGRTHTRGTTAGTQASIVEHDVRSRVDTEPDDDLESEHEIPDDRSVTAIAASTPLPAPAYSEKTKAKHEKLRKKQEHEAMVKREKERKEAELLSKRDKIMNAYTYKQDFSKVPKPSRTKDFGKNIYSSSNAARKEGADPIQHIKSADKKEFKAEEKARKRSNSRGSSLLEEQDPNASMTLPTAPPPMFADSAPLDKSQTKDSDSDAPVATAPKSPKSPKQSSPAAFGAGESSGMERIPTDSNKAATLLGGEPTPSSPALGSTADENTTLKKRRSTKGTTTTGHKRKSSVGKVAEPTGPVAAVGENGAEVPAGEVGDEHIVVAPAAKGADETGTKDPVADASAAPAAAGGSTKLKKRSSTKSTTGKSASASKPAPLTTVNPATVAPETTSRSRSASHSGSTLAPLSAVEASGGRKSTAKAGVTELVGEVSTGLKKRQSVKSTSGRSTSGTRRKSVDPNTSLATEVVAEMEKEKEKTTTGASTRPRSKSKSKSAAPTTSAPAA